MGGEGDGRAYRTWLLETSRYRTLFDFLALVFEDDDRAFMCLPPLVRTAFRTTLPITAFAYLASRTLLDGVPTPRGSEVDEYYDYLLDRLGKAPLTQGERPSVGDLPQEDLYHVLSDEDHEVFASGDRLHPLAPLAQIHLEWGR